MKRIALFLVVVFAAFAPSTHAQNDNGRAPRFTQEKLNVIERNLVIALETPSPGMQASAAQTVRDLKELSPEYSFSRLVIPLMRIVKDEAAEIGPRILASLALEELHSEMGDYAIKRTAQFTDCNRMQHLCMALTAKRVQEEQLARILKQDETREIATTH